MATRRYHEALFYLAVMVLLLLESLPSTLSSADGTSSSSSLYQSIVALDKFGNSAQLRNAQVCSSRHGSLIVAAISTVDRCIVVCSVNRSPLGVKRRDPSANGAVHIIACDDLDRPTIVDDELIMLPDNDNELSETLSRRTITALVCSGVKADAALLRSLLREHSRRLWERYDIIPNPSRVSDACSEILLSFMKYSRNKEVNDAAGPVVVEDDFEMSRPFGLHSLVIGVRRDEIPCIVSIDSSGIQKPLHAKAMGKGSKEADLKLRKMWKKGMDINEVKELCTLIIQDVLKELGSEKGALVLCDVLSPRGLESVTIPVPEIMVPSEQ